MRLPCPLSCCSLRCIAAHCTLNTQCCSTVNDAFLAAHKWSNRETSPLHAATAACTAPLERRMHSLSIAQSTHARLQPTLSAAHTASHSIAVTGGHTLHSLNTYHHHPRHPRCPHSQPTQPNPLHPAQIHRHCLIPSIPALSPPLFFRPGRAHSSVFPALAELTRLLPPPAPPPA